MKIILPLRTIQLALGLAGLLFGAGCTYEVGEVVAPCTEDLSAVTYATDIKPLLQANCYQCHSDQNKGAGGGYSWENFKRLQDYAKSGVLTAVVEQTDKSYKNVYMPRGGQKLSACDIERIKAWVAAGAPQN
ncbi:hypothetical protein [uncultured Hymenobacter sp.]|uniref:hypothetical protein n=1 Tax=uncultured Hymenobacter sp. TaxID=170016 RepID=UPI0035CB3CD2